MPSPWLLYGGLASAIVANVLVVVKFPGGAGNIVAALVCVGAIFLVRYRQKQGWPE